MIKLSIIVPVYNVEKYIRTCIESIFLQGLKEDDFEVIIVNDGSTDKSMEMIADIINNHNNVIVINQENLSLSVARNNGIAKAKGVFILMPDSDDLLIENSLQPLIEKAIETKVDMVVADFMAMSDNEIYNFNGVKQNKLVFKEMTGEQLFTNYLNPNQCYVWRTLYNRRFIIDNHISFIPGINYQDVPFTHECYLKAKRCLKANQQLYIYRFDRPGAASSYFNLTKARSYCIAIGNTWKLTKTKNLLPQTRYKLEEDVFCSFRMMMYKSLYCIRKYSERKQLVSILNKEAPNLNFTHGIKQKFISFMIKNMPYLFIELYYYYTQIVYRKVLLSNFSR